MANRPFPFFHAWLKAFLLSNLQQPLPFQAIAHPLVSLKIGGEGGERGYS